MKHLVFLLCFMSPSILADDAIINPVAKKIKSSILKGMKKSSIELEGYCDLMIEMRHSNGYARIKKVRTSGDSRVCKQAQTAIVPAVQYALRAVRDADVRSLVISA